ncbi:hypothetical protein CSA57_08405 [candidate division KSB3 bacterium]|nr:MAG: hypothetical protein CSA57_08405 [candidate division KSB3 bacterium]
MFSELEAINCLLISSARGDILPQNKLHSINTKRIKLLMKGEYFKWSKQKRDDVYRLRAISNFWAHKIDTFRQLRLAVVDDPIYFAPLVKKFKHRGIPVIASCHNLETVVPDQIVQSHQQTLLRKELELLSYCQLIITISREETILLKNLNMETFYLPYYPIDEIQNRLMKIRECREGIPQKKHLLLIGNARNIATRKGMLKLIQFWKTQHLSTDSNKLLIAGYATDIFLNTILSDNSIQFLGPLTNTEYDELLKSVKACICYQESGSGALTRICEMLVAGIPVVANMHAARSYFHIDGVIEFSELIDLENALQAINEQGSFIPIPQRPETLRLRSNLANFLAT